MSTQPASRAGRGFALSPLRPAHPSPLSRCRRRTCPGYAPLWAGDQRQKLFANLNAYADQVPSGVRSPQVLVSAVTAPGVPEGMAWDGDFSAAPAPMPTRASSDAESRAGSLRCGTKARLSGGETYTAGTPALPTRRPETVAAGPGVGAPEARPAPRPSRPCLFDRRGEASGRPLRRASRQPAGAIRLRVHQRKRRVRDPRAAAAYLSSYFVNRKGHKASLEESVLSNWMPRSIVHVSTGLTVGSGVTMRSLRLKRFAWIVWRRYFAWDKNFARS